MEAAYPEYKYDRNSTTVNIEANIANFWIRYRSKIENTTSP